MYFLFKPFDVLAVKRNIIMKYFHTYIIMKYGAILLWGTSDVQSSIYRFEISNITIFNFLL